MQNIKLTPKQKAVVMAANKNGKVPQKVAKDSPKVIENMKEKGLVKEKKGSNGKTETALTKAGEKAKKASTPKAKAEPKKTAKTAEKSEKASKTKVRKDTKQYKILQMLSRKTGATIKQLAEATGWKETTLRGTPGALKIKLGIEVETEKREGKDTIYRMTTDLESLL